MVTVCKMQVLLLNQLNDQGFHSILIYQQQTCALTLLVSPLSSSLPRDNASDESRVAMIASTIHSDRDLNIGIM